MRALLPPRGPGKLGHRRTCAAAVLVLLLPAVAAAEPAGFPNGVAAGEVTPTSAMLWTRAAQPGPIALRVAPRAALATCAPGARAKGVRRRTLTARAVSDLTVRSTVRDLRPATRYYYRFCGASGSRLGRFRTAPPTRANVPIRFGLTGDADGTIDPATGQPAYNRFEVYRRMALERNAFNVNLGDVMYSDSAVAGVPPALTLPEKWTKYRLNLSYPNLRRLRGTAALYSHWDDHEFADDFSRPLGGLPLFQAGSTAFLDYNPARYTPSTGLYRHFRWGRNVELFFLDERAFRSAPASADPACKNPASGAPDPLPQLPQDRRAALAQAIGLPAGLAQPVSDPCKALLENPSRTMLGAAQLARFERDVRRSTATFKVIVNEVPIMQLYWLPYDRWEGYPIERRALLQFLQANVRNLIFLTTDFHANLVDQVRLSTFGETGPTKDTGFIDAVTGPVALKTMAVDTNLKTNSAHAADALHGFFKAPRPLGLGLSCAALDVYSYEEVEVTAEALTVAIKDADGRPVEESPTGPACTTVTVPRR